MNHYDKAAWMNYIQNQLSDEERSEYEEHLYTCDVCLEVYSQCMTEHVEPRSSDTMQVISASIMETISMMESEQRRMSLRKSRLIPDWARRPMALYAAAASITILLMASGVFDAITSQVGYIDEYADSSKGGRSYSDQLMNKTVSVINAISSKAERGVSVEP